MHMKMHAPKKLQTLTKKCRENFPFFITQIILHCPLTLARYIYIYMNQRNKGLYHNKVLCYACVLVHA